MTSLAFTEFIVEEATLAWLEYLGWMVKHGQGILPCMLASVVQACLVRNSVDENAIQRYRDTRGNAV